MIIKRVLNHNAVISVTHQGLDVLLMGKGIAFKKRIGDRINSDAIEKSFVLKNSDNMNRFTELFITVPEEVVACSERIINLGKIKLGKNLDEILYINLTELFAQRVLSGMKYEDDDADLLLVVKKKYPREYKCVKEIGNNMAIQYQYQLNSSELLYLTVHVKRLVKNLKEISDD
ncbi:CAT RNA binding domain-containing protein [Streptococcus agalactiae]